jgi:methyl-accepting chemotaxis protein
LPPEKLPRDIDNLYKHAEQAAVGVARIEQRMDRIASEIANMAVAMEHLASAMKVLADAQLRTHAAVVVMQPKLERHEHRLAVVESGGE